MRNYSYISGIDHAIGRVIAELKTHGLDKNTVIIYMADNGYYAIKRVYKSGLTKRSLNERPNYL